MNPRDFQQVAMRLASCNTSADFRSSISRAYYAAHHVGVEILNNIGIIVAKGPHAHVDVIYYLNYSQDKDLMKVSSQLSDLQSDRIKADYHMLDIDIETQGKAIAAVSQTSRMIQILDVYKETDPARKKEATKNIKECIDKIKSRST